MMNNMHVATSQDLDEGLRQQYTYTYSNHDQVESSMGLIDDG